MQTTFYPRHAFKIEHDHPVPVRHLARARSRAGDWYYHGLPKPARLSWPAILFSLSVHGLLLWGGGDRPALRPVVVVKDDPIIQMVMPDLPDEEEKPVEELQEAVELDPGVVVPKLVDLPSAVDLNTAFVQPLDLSVTLQTGLDTASLTSIPLKIAPGGPRAGAMKDLFNISQLDRVPEPIVQAGAGLIMAGALYVCWQLYRLGRSATRGELNAAAESWAAFHRGELARQREALRTVWSWYLAPFVPGMLVFLAGVSFTEANPAPFPARLAVFLVGAGLMAAVFAVIAWINALAAKKLDAQIAALDQARE